MENRTQLIKQAFILGYTSLFDLEEWQKAPAQDPRFIPLLSGLKVGEGLPILDAWNKGRMKAILEESEVKVTMEIGSKVSVKTKHYGTKTGTIINHASHGWIIKPDDHPRNIAARIEDIKIIS